MRRAFVCKTVCKIIICKALYTMTPYIKPPCDELLYIKPYIKPCAKPLHIKPYLKLLYAKPLYPKPLYKKPLYIKPYTKFIICKTSIYKAVYKAMCNAFVYKAVYKIIIYKGFVYRNFISAKMRRFSMT